MNLITYPDCDMMYIDLANTLAGELKNALFHNDRVSFAVPGGTTPGPVFDELCAADLDWSRVDVLLTDERRLPPEHERSNERLVRERLLVSRAAAANFVRLVPLEGEAGADIETLRTRLDAHLPLGLLLLGMGGDMHTASLFPGSPQFEEALAGNAPPLMLVDAPEGLEPRVTLTAPVLKGAVSTHVVIRGDDKKEALETARHARPSEAPVALVLGQADIHWAP